MRRPSRRTPVHTCANDPSRTPVSRSSRTLLQLQRAHALDPLPGRVLHDLAKRHVGLRDLHDLSVVLAEVVAGLHLVEQVAVLTQRIWLSAEQVAVLHTHT